MEPHDAFNLLEIRLFGAFDVRRNGEPMPSLRTRKGQWLLALLVLKQDRQVDRAWLAGTLWPETTEELAFTSLRKSLTDLRHALGKEAYRLHAPTPRSLAFDLTGAFCDVTVFDAALAQEDLALLEQAVALYRGPLLESCTDDWLLLERNAREQAYLSTLEMLASHSLEAGDADAAIERLRQCIALDPLRETAQRALLQALARAGNLAAVTQTYRDLRLYLRRELNADPAPETAALYQQLRAEAQNRLQRPLPPFPPSLPARDVTASNIPRPVTGLVGRESEIQEVKSALSKAPLVTLTGTGGVGKTRLAIEVAQRYADDYPDGVWFIDLAPLSDLARVTQAVASVLGVREQPGLELLETLTRHLHKRQTLLVLDNCEHLLSACIALCSALLHHCPDVCILATSRQALGITGEVVWRVPSLSLPDPERLPSQKDLVSLMVEYDAIRLFADRASLLRPDFRLTAQNVRAVAQICHRLDGIPLAIELAAARIRVLTPEQIAGRLNDLFHLLTGGSQDALPRQQTLRATLDWSYNQLSPQEQTLLRHLSVFAGSWTLDAAEQICPDAGIGRLALGIGRWELGIDGAAADKDVILNAKRQTPMEDWEVLDLLASLVDKSLVHFELEENGEGRYRMLNTVRQYGQEHLRETGEEEALHTRHFDYYLELAEEVRPHLHDPDSVVWLDRLKNEHDNLREGLRFCAEVIGRTRGVTDLTVKRLRMVCALEDFWDVRGYWDEGRSRLNDALATAEDANPVLRTKTLIAAGNLARKQGDVASASACFEEGLTLAQQSGDEKLVASALRNLGTLLVNLGDFTKARGLFEQSLAIARKLGDKAALAADLVNLATTTQPQGDYEATFRLLQESLAIFQELGDQRSVGVVLNNLGNAAFHLGDYEAARAYHEQNLAIRRDMGNIKGISNALGNLGNVVMELGDYGAARGLFEESLAIRREIGEKPMIGYSLHNLGLTAFRQGDYTAAYAYHRESLLFLQEAKDRFALIDSLEAFASLADMEGNSVRATHLYAAGAALRETIGAPQSPNHREEYNAQISALRTALGEEEFGAAWEQGHAMPLEQALEYAASDSSTAIPIIS